MMTLMKWLAGLSFTLLLGATASAQNSNSFGLTFDNEAADDRLGDPELTWVRGRYDNYFSGGRNGGGGGPPRGWWSTDYPDSDRNFLRGVQRYTTFDANSHGFTWLDLTDPKLFEYTFLYLNFKRRDGGYGPNIREDEAAALREFMLRGGFVLIDDFWGQSHWDDFLIEIVKIFPDRELTKLSTTHPIFHSFFDINEIAQVPGRAFTWNYDSGFYLDDPQYPPSVHAILDDDGRVMLVANHNTDLGDGWEHTFYAPFPTGYSNEAYKIGINYLIYAYSH